MNIAHSRNNTQQHTTWCANVRNIVGPNMLRAFAHHVMCCCVLLRLFGSCWMKFETGQTSEPTKCQHFYCFAVIEAWSNNVAFVCTAHPTMLRRRTRTTCHVSLQIHANKKSTWRRRWKMSQSPLYFHTSANIAQQETTLLGPTMLCVVASVCTGLKEPLLILLQSINELAHRLGAFEEEWRTLIFIGK